MLVLGKSAVLWSQKCDLTVTWTYEVQISYFIKTDNLNAVGWNQVFSLIKTCRIKLSKFGRYTKRDGVVTESSSLGNNKVWSGADSNSDTSVHCKQRLRFRRRYLCWQRSPKFTHNVIYTKLTFTKRCTQI